MGVQLLKIYDLLEEITDDVGESRKSLFGARRTFDSDYVLTIVEAVRAVLPRDLAEAQKVLAEQDRIIEEARTYAAAIVEDARVRAHKAVEEQKVVQAANAQSEQILADARREAEALRLAADEYALSVLDDLSTYVSEYRTIIDENKSEYLDRRNRALRDSRSMEQDS